MENPTIHSITISDFNEKIHFLRTRPSFSFDETFRISKSLNKSITNNYIQEYVQKYSDYKLMDTTINSKLKAKISLVGDITIKMLYDSSIDIYYLNLINQRFIEALNFLSKAKRLKIEQLLKRYMDTTLAIDDTLFLLDPRIRSSSSNLKVEMNLKDMISHSIYTQKFQKSGLYLRSVAFHHSSKNFTQTKNKIEDCKKLRNKNITASFSFNNEILLKAKNKRISLLQSYGGQTNIDFSQMKNAEDNLRKQSIQADKNVNIDYTTVGNIQASNNLVNGNYIEDGIILDYPTIKVNLNHNSSGQRKKSQDNTNENTGFQNNNLFLEKIVEGNDMDINLNKFISSNNQKSNLLDIDFTKINSPEKKSSNFTNQISVSESVSSLNNLDLGSVLSSINLIGNDQLYFSPTKHEDKKDSYEEHSSNFRNRAASNFTSYDFSKGGFNNLSHSEVNTINNGNQYNFNNSNINMAFNQPINSSFQFENNIIKNDLMFNINKSRQSQDLFGLNNLLLSSTQMEDIFDSNTIKKQIRGVIIEKGILLNHKGKYDDIKYRGQIALELSNNFHINNKSLFFKTFHPYWNDNSYFNKLIPDKNIMEDENFGNYKINCQNIRGYLRLLDYNINVKSIEPAAEFKVNTTFKENRYKLEILGLINEKFKQKLKNTQLMIMIMLNKNINDVKILKSTDSSYLSEEKKISFTFNNFNEKEKFLVGMLFETFDSELVEVVKVMYRYMDVLPSSNSGELSYLDEKGHICNLDVIKKCMVEIRFSP